MCSSDLEDELDEAAQIVGAIRRGMAHRRPGDFAVIYRTNAQSRPIEQALVQARIPHVLVGGRKFYERREVRDLLAYLKLVVNPADDVAFQRIVNVPTRGVGDKALETIATEAERLKVPLREGARYVAQTGGRLGNTLAAFTLMMDRFQQLALVMEPGDLVLQVARDTGYLAELEAENTDEARGRIENIQALSRAVEEDETTEDPDAPPAPTGPLDRLRAFLDRVSLAGQADELPDEGTGAVTLLTAHLAKGLEYPVVFVVGLAEKCFPHARAESEDDIEEERRLAYVAITRAREQLTLSWPQRRRGPDGYWEPTLPSRFLKEIPRDVLAGDLPPPPIARPALSAPRPPTPPTRAPVAPPTPPRTGLFARPPAPTLRPASSAGLRRLEPDSMESFKVGVEVFHPLLGAGTISRREGIPSNPKLTIHFKDHGPRTIYAASAGLEILLP